MNYAIRNSLILATTLLMMLGAGWLYIHFSFGSQLEELMNSKLQKQQELEQVAQMAAGFERVNQALAQQIYIRDHYPKSLFSDPNTGRLYDYNRRLNRGISFTQLNFSVQDSVLHRDHGVVMIMVNGEGMYRNLFNFIHRIEHSQPMLHIRNLQIQNFNQLGKLTQVQFQMSLHAYYNRNPEHQFDRSPKISAPYGNIGHNPFYSLVHPVPPNDENLIDVDRSQLVGMTVSYIIIKDQLGRIHRLSTGDPVYLGHLQRFDPQSKHAVFRLNRGGLLDNVTLSLDP